MEFIEVPNTMQVQLLFSQENQTSQNTLYFEKSSAIVGTDFDAMGDFLKAWWNTNLAPSRVDDSVLFRISMADLTNESNIGFDYVEGLPIAGTSVSAPLPQNVALCIKFSTGFRGRSMRGRNYVGGLGQNQATGSSINAPSAASIVAAYDLLVTQNTLPDFTFVVVSRYNNLAPRATGITTPVLTVSANTTLDSQRRRLPGRGI